MTERFQKLLEKREKTAKTRKKQKPSIAYRGFGSYKKFLNDEPFKKGNTERVLPAIKIKSNSYEITYKYDERKHLNLNQPYELWARDYGHFTGICVWKDIRRDAAEFYLDDGSFRTVILTKTTYIPVKD